jgi:hypothetical protein
VAVFSVIDQLLALPRFDPTSVSKITTVPLGDAPGSNAYFRVYAGVGTRTVGWFQSAELRVAQPAAAKTAGDRLELTIARDVAIGRRDVVRRYGEPSGIDPASPTALGDEPTYYVFRRGTQIFSFGFLRSDPSRASTIVIDRGTR